MRRPRAVGTRAAGDEIIHPRAAALRLARMPVGVERAEMPARGIKDIGEFHIRMPHLDLAERALRDAKSEHASRELEQTTDHMAHRKIRAQDFFVEVVTRATQLLRPEREFPRREPPDG